MNLFKPILNKRDSGHKTVAEVHADHLQSDQNATKEDRENFEMKQSGKIF